MSEDFTVVSSVPAALGQISLQDSGGNNIATAGTNNGAVYFVSSTGLTQRVRIAIKRCCKRHCMHGRDGR